MRRLDPSSYRRARDFVMSHARPVDRAFFEWTFEGAKPEGVWVALAEFANPDGGFGHGMEPDCRLPASSTLGTITAFQYLVQTGAPHSHPLVEGGIRYLTSTYDRTLKGWRMIPPEVNDYPRAGWWNFDSKKAEADVRDRWINPSACVVADLFRYSRLVDGKFLSEVEAKAMSELEAKKHSIEGQDYLAFVELAEALPPATQSSVWPILKARAKAAVVTDPASWTGYGIRPLWAVTDPSSPLAAPLEEAIRAQLDFEIERQSEDGSWHPFWSWGRFEEEWKRAKLEWQGQLTVKTLRSLKAFGRIS
jgi:hypothetical protein